MFVSRKSSRQRLFEPIISGDAKTRQDELDMFEEQWLRIKIADEDPVPGFPITEIEGDIVEELVKRHTEWINLHDKDDRVEMQQRM